MDNIINPRQYRVFGQNRKLLYTFEMNEETERDLFEKMFFLGLDSPKTKEDTMDRYFDLVRQTTMEFPSIKLNDKSMYEKTKARFIASMKENIKRTKNHKLSKEEIILLFLAAALSTGFITLSKIKNSIENTGSNLDARNTAIANITEVLKDNNIVEEVVIGKKGEMLRRIGSLAREEIEELLDMKVNLKLWVKVRKDWRDSDLMMRNFGYDKREI